MLAKLRHPNILQLYGIAMDPEAAADAAHGDLYMVMEFCSGGDLMGYIRTPHFGEPGEFARVVLEMLSGVAFLHGKLIAHRDLKVGAVATKARAVCGRSHSTSGRGDGQRKLQWLHCSSDRGTVSCQLPFCPRPCPPHHVCFFFLPLPPPPLP